MRFYLLVDFQAIFSAFSYNYVKLFWWVGSFVSVITLVKPIWLSRYYRGFRGITMVKPRFEKTVVGFTMVLPMVFGWLLSKKNEWFYHGNTRVLPW